MEKVIYRSVKVFLLFLTLTMSQQALATSPGYRTVIVLKKGDFYIDNNKIEKAQTKYGVKVQAKLTILNNDNLWTKGEVAVTTTRAEGIAFDFKQVGETKIYKLKKVKGEDYFYIPLVFDKPGDYTVTIKTHLDKQLNSPNSKTKYRDVNREILIGAFAIDGKVYYGTGYDPVYSYLREKFIKEHGRKPIKNDDKNEIMDAFIWFKIDSEKKYEEQNKSNDIKIETKAKKKIKTIKAGDNLTVITPLVYYRNMKIS